MGVNFVFRGIVYLTLLGGGVFGNDIGWIMESISMACERMIDCKLDVRIVNYSDWADPSITRLCEAVNARSGGSAM